MGRSLQIGVIVASFCYYSILSGASWFDRTPVEYFVGDWTSGGNFTQWSQGKILYLGDTLKFTLSGSDTIFAVNKDGYESCKWSFPGIIPGWNRTSWNWTVVPILGDNYYISSVEEKCKAGLKLMVSVLLPSPSPAPPVYTPKTYRVGDDQGWAIGVDLSQWIAGKKFYFGDAFEFEFNASRQSLVEVTSKAFESCNVSYFIPVFGFQHGDPDDVNITIVPFVGHHYYTSSIADDCKKGLKVELDILSTSDYLDGPSPSPDAAESPGGIADAESGSVFVAVSFFQIIVLLLALL